MISTSVEAFDYEGLSQRNKPQWIDPSKASDLVAKLNEEEKSKGKNRKTFGRTDNGTGMSFKLAWISKTLRCKQILTEWMTN